MLQNGFGLRLCYHGRQRGHISLLYGLQAPEMLEQSACGALAHTGDFAQLGRAIANLTAFAVEGHRKAVGLIANKLS